MRTVQATSGRKAGYSIDIELQELVEAEFDGLGKTSALKVIRLHEPEQRDTKPTGFSDEEQAFIDSVAKFLHGRKNADLLIEGVWSQAMEDVAPVEAKAESSDATPASIAVDKEEGGA
ncbi:MAG: hypothetical protein Q8L53_16205 [Aestuariivirga sp.]|nr:hypothetical protein [Aestuariivirga sp.]